MLRRLPMPWEFCWRRPEARLSFWGSAADYSLLSATESSHSGISDPLHLPNFESASEDPTHANARGDLDASAERDLYGIPSATLAVRPRVAGGAGFVATPQRRCSRPAESPLDINQRCAMNRSAWLETAVERSIEIVAGNS